MSDERERASAVKAIKARRERKLTDPRKMTDKELANLKNNWPVPAGPPRVTDDGRLLGRQPIRVPNWLTGFIAPYAPEERTGPYLLVYERKEFSPDFRRSFQVYREEEAPEPTRNETVTRIPNGFWTVIRQTVPRRHKIAKPGASEIKMVRRWFEQDVAVLNDNGQAKIHYREIEFDKQYPDAWKPDRAWMDSPHDSKGRPIDVEVEVEPEAPGELPEGRSAALRYGDFVEEAEPAMEHARVRRSSEIRVRAGSIETAEVRGPALHSKTEEEPMGVMDAESRRVLASVKVNLQLALAARDTLLDLAKHRDPDVAEAAVSRLRGALEYVREQEEAVERASLA